MMETVTAFVLAASQARRKSFPALLAIIEDNFGERGEEFGFNSKQVLEEEGDRQENLNSARTDKNVEF